MKENLMDDLGEPQHAQTMVRSAILIDANQETDALFVTRGFTAVHRDPERGPNDLDRLFYRHHGEDRLPSLLTIIPFGAAMTGRQAFERLQTLCIEGQRVRAPWLLEVPAYCGCFAENVRRESLIIAPCPADAKGNIGDWVVVVSLMGAVRSVRVMPSDVSIGAAHRLMVAFR